MSSKKAGIWSFLNSRTKISGTARNKTGRIIPALELLEQRDVPAIFVVSNTQDSGSNSLRQAILNANANPGPDLIQFNINGGGQQTIRPLSQLPTINGQVTIDGWSQPGWNGSPLIELNGSLAPSAPYGLVATGSNVTIRGMVINHFWDGIAMFGNGAVNNKIVGNWIGTDATGTVAIATPGKGIRMEFGVSNSQIGGLSFGERNVITGYALGVSIEGTSQLPSVGNVIQGNFIGTDKTGNALPAGSGMLHGTTFGAHTYGSLIGGTASGAGNVISGTQREAVLLFGADVKGATVQGNVIGLGVDRKTYLGNKGAGVHIGIGSTGHQIGGSEPGSGNLISGNADGVVISSDFGQSSNGNSILGNIIGPAGDGSEVRDGSGNLVQYHGVGIGNAYQNIVGGDGLAANIIGGNRFWGILVDGKGAKDNRIQGNFIGLLPGDGGLVRPNGGGIQISGGAANTIIGVNDNPVGKGNIISGNSGYGIRVNGMGTDETVIAGNMVGTNAAGNGQVANNSAGIYISGGARNTRIGTNGNGQNDEMEGNLISGNKSAGVWVQDTGTVGTIIAGNIIGTDMTGSKSIPNLFGIGAYAGATGTRIGSDGNGLSDQAEGNLVSGNTYYGIYLTENGPSVIDGNRIGTTANGSQALPNGNMGMIVRGSGVMVGGPVGNLVAGNKFHGIYIDGSKNTVYGNRIGTSALPNGGAGIQVYGNGNTIGGPLSSQANIITGNGGSGVLVVGSATGNTIRGNSIYSNSGLGIDLLGNGVTLNDAGDQDSGPHGLQNFPTLIEAIPGDSSRIRGSFDGAPGTAITVDFYASTQADPTGYGEGQRYLGSTTLVTDGSGSAVFDVTLASSLNPNEWVSATATNAVTGTSEYSRAIEASNLPPVADAGGPYSILEGGAISLSAASSADPDGVIASYEWDFEYDGVNFDTDAQGESVAFSAVDLDGPTTRVVAVRVTDNLGATSIATSTVQVLNQAPTIVGLSVTSPIHEGSEAILSGTIQDPGNDSFTLTINWEDGSPPQVVSLPAGTTSFSVTHIYADDKNGGNPEGSYLISATLLDDDGGEASGTQIIQVENVVPQNLAISGSPMGNQGIAFTLAGSATDPGLLDLEAGLQFSWSLTRDGETVDLAGLNSLGEEFTYLPTANGVYEATLRVTDKDGGWSETSHTVTVTGQPGMEVLPGGRLLVIGGEGNDWIRINGFRQDGVKVNFGTLEQTFTGLSEIVIYANGGDDRIQVAGSVRQTVYAFGGAGNDVLMGGGGINVLVGGDGNDTLSGKGGRSILIGGKGSDVMQGGDADDLLVAGFTSLDDNFAALALIQAEWGSNRDFANRVACLTGTGGPGLNGSVLLRPNGPDQNVFDDQSVDLLAGNLGRDWMLYNQSGGTALDQVFGMESFEIPFAVDLNLPEE